MYVEKLTQDEAVLGYDYMVEVKIYEDNVLVVPDSATLTIKASDNNSTSDVLGLSFPGTIQKIVDAQAMTVADDGTLSYVVPAASMPSLAENCVIEIDYVIITGDSPDEVTTHNKAVFLFDIVNNALKCNVTDDDLKCYAPQIADDLWTGSGMPTSYSGTIAEAFRIVKRLIKDKGNRPTMILDGSQVREIIILKTLEMLCFDFSKSKDDIWWSRFSRYTELFQTRLDSLRIKYDSDQSGTIEKDEQELIGQVVLER